MTSCMKCSAILEGRPGDLLVLGLHRHLKGMHLSIRAWPCHSQDSCRGTSPLVVEGNIGGGGTVPPTVEGRGTVPEAQVSMDLLRDGVPVSNVLLGEQLEIRWRITAPGEYPKPRPS